MTPPASKGAAPKASALTTQTVSTTSASFGLMITIAGEPLVITASDLTGIAANGVTFNYDRAPPQQLGSLTDFLNNTLAKPPFSLNVTSFLSEIEGLPVVGGLIQTLMTLQVSIGQFDLRIQGTDKTQPPSSFKLAGAVALPSPVAVGPLTIDGLTFGVSYAAASS
jgi:hypothetical protein